jgi:hypothetical protein
VLIWVTGHCNPATVSRNRYGVEKTVDTHKILIFQTCSKFFLFIEHIYEFTVTLFCNLMDLQKKVNYQNNSLLE